MEQHKFFSIYLKVICIHILVVLGLGLWGVFNGETITYALSELERDMVQIFLLFFLFSFIPVYIAMEKLPWNHWLLTILPFVFLIPMPYLLYHPYTCTGKLCSLGNLSAFLLIFWVEIIYIVNYLLGKYLRKWFISVSILTLKALLVLYFIISLFILYNYMTVIRPYSNLVQQLGYSDTLNSEEAVNLCDDSRLDQYLTNDCWRKAIKHRPGIDICSQTKNKTNCLDAMLEIYRESVDECHRVTPEYLKDSQGSFKKDVNGNWLLDNTKMIEIYKKCWTDNSKKYPSIDICKVGYDDDQEKCRLFLDSKK